MMELCVAVCPLDRAHLPSLLPERRAFAQSEGEALLTDAPEQLFTCGQTAPFLRDVK